MNIRVEKERDREGKIEIERESERETDVDTSARLTSDTDQVSIWGLCMCVAVHVLQCVAVCCSARMDAGRVSVGCNGY